MTLAYFFTKNKIRLPLTIFIITDAVDIRGVHFKVYEGEYHEQYRYFKVFSLSCFVFGRWSWRRQQHLG
jgi:hypothetical protein